MEIKAPGRKPQWLQDILDQYGLVEQKFQNTAAPTTSLKGWTIAHDQAQKV